MFYKKCHKDYFVYFRIGIFIKFYKLQRDVTSKIRFSNTDVTMEIKLRVPSCSSCFLLLNYKIQFILFVYS